MDKLTYYDELAGCYKIKPEASANVIQRLGQLEHGIEELKVRIEKYKIDCDMTAPDKKCLKCNLIMFWSILGMIEEETE
jgi:hypothetical protein